MNFISDVSQVPDAPISCMVKFRFKLAARSGRTTGDGRAADVCKGSYTQVLKQKLVEGFLSNAKLATRYFIKHFDSLQWHTPGVRKIVAWP